MNKKVNQIARVFNIILIFFIGIIISYYNQTNKIDYFSKDNNSNTKEIVKLIKIVDGDTLIVASPSEKKEFKVRLIGIDTPESSYNYKLIRDSQKTHKNIQKIMEMGKKSKEFTKQIVTQSKYLYLEYDIQLYDKYNRKLAYVYLDNGQMLNYILVREGYAKVYTLPPNIKYQEKFLEAQKLAQKEKKGLWKGSE